MVFDSCVRVMTSECSEIHVWVATSKRRSPEEEELDNDDEDTLSDRRPSKARIWLSGDLLERRVCQTARVRRFGRKETSVRRLGTSNPDARCHEMSNL